MQCFVCQRSIQADGPLGFLSLLGPFVLEPRINR